MKQRQYLIYFSIALIGFIFDRKLSSITARLKTSSPASTLRLGFNNWPGMCRLANCLRARNFQEKQSGC